MNTLILFILVSAASRAQCIEQERCLAGVCGERQLLDDTSFLQVDRQASFADAKMHDSTHGATGIDGNIAHADAQVVATNVTRSAAVPSKTSKSFISNVMSSAKGVADGARATLDAVSGPIKSGLLSFMCPDGSPRWTELGLTGEGIQCSQILGMNDVADAYCATIASSAVGDKFTEFQAGALLVLYENAGMTAIEALNTLMQGVEQGAVKCQASLVQKK